MSKQITNVQVAAFSKSLQKDLSYKVLQRAVTTNGIYAASENNFLSRDNTTVFSDEIETSSVTNQESSGRCWLFAELNVIRHQIVKDHDMEDLELSQSYSYFWDKLEKSNMFFESIIATANSSLDDRYVARLMEWPQGDGGWWEYAVDVIEKYGIVPKHVMPESVTTKKSGQLNVLLDKKLRKGGLELRQMVEQKSDSGAIQKRKNELLAEVYRFLTVALGTPPETFTFSYKDKKKKLHRDVDITPLAFLKKYHDVSFDDYAVLNAEVARYRENRDILTSRLPQDFLGDMAPSDGAFYLYADISKLGMTTPDSIGMAEAMLNETHVAVTPGVDFDKAEGHRHLRLSYAGSTADMKEASRRINDWLPSYLRQVGSSAAE